MELKLRSVSSKNESESDYEVITNDAHFRETVPPVLALVLCNACIIFIHLILLDKFA